MIDALHLYLWALGGLVVFGFCGSLGIRKASALGLAVLWPAVLPLGIVGFWLVRMQSRWDLYRAMRSAGR